MEVADIAKWQAEGKSLEQTRELIEEKYRDYGNPTDTPPLVHPEATPTPAPSSTLETPPKLPTAGFTAGRRLLFGGDPVNTEDVSRDVPIEYAFHFKNAGSTPLNIIDTWSHALV